MKKHSEGFQLYPIGFVRVSESEGSFILEIDAAYRTALKEMKQFSHVMVFWWAHKMDTEKYRQITTAELPYAPGVVAGVFACRSEYRPNPIAVTTVPVIDVDEENGVVILAWIDAFDGTPVIDIKPYIPISDRFRDIKVAEWLQDWPEWAEDAAAYFEEHATDFGE